MLYDERIPNTIRGGEGSAGRVSPFMFRERDIEVKSLTGYTEEAPELGVKQTWGTPKTAPLMEAIQDKLNYRVTFYKLPDFRAKHAFGVRVPDSLIYTAIISYNPEECRYEVFSPRFARQKFVHTWWGGEAINAVVSNNIGRLARVVSQIRAISAEELIRVSIGQIWNDGFNLMTKPEGVLQDVVRTHFFNYLGRDHHAELLQVLDAQADGDTSITFSKESEMMQLYRKFDVERKKLVEKVGYIGKQKQVFVVQPNPNGPLWLVASDNNSRYWDFDDGDHTEHYHQYNSVQDLPREVYRKMCTLDVESTREECKNDDVELEGVGFLPYTPDQGEKCTAHRGEYAPDNCYLLPLYCLFVGEDIHREIVQNGTYLPPFSHTNNL